MTDIIKGVVMLKAGNLMRYLAANQHVVAKSVECLLEEFDDLKSESPTVIAFGGSAHLLAAKHLPANRYSRLVRVTHYADSISQTAYRERVLSELGPARPGRRPRRDRVKGHPASVTGSDNHSWRRWVCSGAGSGLLAAASPSVHHSPGPAGASAGGLVLDPAGPGQNRVLRGPGPGAEVPHVQRGDDGPVPVRVGLDLAHGNLVQRSPHDVAIAFLRSAPTLT
jgi:hypothetical protein